MSDQLDAVTEAMTGSSILDALRECMKRRPGLVRGEDVAAQAGVDTTLVTETLGAFQQRGVVAYYPRSGYVLDEAKLLAEVGPTGGIGGRAVGARTMFPISYQTLSDVTKERNAKLIKADENRRRTRDRLRELAQEGAPMPRRALRSVES